MEAPILENLQKPSTLKTLQEWRQHILNRFLLLLFPLGTITALVDIASYIIDGTLMRNAVTPILEIIGIMGIGFATLRHSLPYAFRAGMPLVLLVLIGLDSVFKDGIDVDGRFLFLLSIIFSVVFFGGRIGWWVFAVSILSMAARLVFLGPGMTDASMASAITHIVIFIFFSAIAVVPAAFLIDGLNDSTQKALVLAHAAEDAQKQAEQQSQEVTRNMLALLESRAELAETQAQRDHTERLIQARSEAVQAVVHDLNHTVQGIQSALDVWLLALRETNADATVVAAGCDRLHTALDQQRTLLQEMRDAALLEGGTLILQPKSTDLGVLVQRVAAQLQPRYDLAECLLTVTRVEHVSNAWCDPRRVQRVIYNILENALRYTSSVRDDGIVQVTITDDAESVICVVQDNGCGIAPTDLEQLGQKFVRLARGEGAPEGMGVGLNFAIGIMRLSGGTLTIDSLGEGQGTTVTLCLPLARESQRIALEHPLDKLTLPKRPDTTAL